MSARTSWRGALGAVAFAVLAVLAGSCGKPAATVAPHVNTPPEVLALFPLPRATGVLYDTAIWVQFDRALLASSVDTTTIYLKVDTRRVPITVEYQAIVNRIQLTPRGPLDLGKTYTAEVSARVKTAAGDSLGQPLRWQFSTNTLRRITYSTPARGAREGPHTLLTWGGNGGPSNGIVYEVYASSDSAAVAGRTIPPLQNAVYVNYLPRLSWEPGRRTYWAVTAVNLATGERLGGEVTHFDVYPSDWPTDSLVVPLTDFGGAGSNNRVQFCATPTLTTGLAYNSGVRWSLNGDRAWLRVADARITMYANPVSAALVASAGTQVWFGQNAWSACAFTLNGVPYTETNGYLATAAVNGLRADFVSPALSAFAEAAGRYGGWHGVLLRSTNSNAIQWDVLNFPVPGPTLTVWYYRSSATPPAAPAPRSR